MDPRRAPAGFTLVELITTLALIGVLVGLAVPSFAAYLHRVRVRAALDGFTADLFYARGQAVRLQTRIHVRLEPAAGCAREYSIAPAGSPLPLKRVSLRDHHPEVCLFSNVARPLSIDSRGLLVGSPRTVRARRGAQLDSVTISIVGRVHRWQ